MDFFLFICIFPLFVGIIGFCLSSFINNNQEKSWESVNYQQQEQYQQYQQDQHQQDQDQDQDQHQPQPQQPQLQQHQQHQQHQQPHQPPERQIPHQLQNKKYTSSQISCDIIEDLVNSFGKLCLEPELTEVEKARKRLNERMELYQLMARREIPGDGNCQMHALSDQIYGNLNHSRAIRKSIVSWLRKNKNLSLPNGARLSSFVSTSWDRYCNNMAKNGTWGDHLTLIAAAEIFKTNISIISTAESEGNFVIEVTPSKKSDSGILLSHFAEFHYGSLCQLHN
ncbi:hypothetical protein DICPUDRAFT_78671 [Dictyostelium purpureum]|uniref:OTU domain-containing protein n=1 Tax=Dictyostelium purpureum TaxID=5786 RepID=F0ZK74_DICPU|nr:uncharacterized protein DICPUDRAFT_78671 [Dictyostelium purpureum]EGC35636.1 hypothetical protein DICPUDRAFT_78671 [Dictyostelium purpureum]|eukprot:XP_003287815.1 hypothetical protein DICPUDRAFT_78671 [Dictyostelium purpureum]